ncbi:hypothetical protein, conserved [Leishmania tarentolae]|uniref:PUB domain-containing protein n=1 Tax=Leishmania tarentolae TaxID=5689 RepID=A0A640KAN8_LEITA|nr:hypothetical protein, conserved [Leishmania tarentolae]
MSDVNLPVEWETVCNTADTEIIRECIDSVFRRLLANMLLEFENPKFRQVKKDNKVLNRLTQSLPSGFIEFLFSSIGFVKHDDVFIFEGSLETLKHGDAVLTYIEDSLGRKKLHAVESQLHCLRKLAATKAKNNPTPTETAPVTSRLQRAQNTFQEGDAKHHTQPKGTEMDLTEEQAIKEVVRNTLLKTGRVRNSFFEARDFTVRTMNNGRVYACTEKCPVDCVEAHWHFLTGRNILYAHLAHLSADGARLLHLGPEHGYQYNSLPGSTNFGKMTHCNEKLMDENGRLLYIKHDDTPVKVCIYCGRPFAELLL